MAGLQNGNVKYLTTTNRGEFRWLALLIRGGRLHEAEVLIVDIKKKAPTKVELISYSQILASKELSIFGHHIVEPHWCTSVQNKEENS